VFSVLAGARGFDELRGDAEADEPDGELGESAKSVGSERGAVIGADPLGEAELTEEALEHLSGENELGSGEAAAVQEETRVHVLYGEGIAEGTISEAELALEVERPGLVGFSGKGLGAAGMPAANTLASRLHETLLVDDLVNGGAGRERQLGLVCFEIPADLLGAVVREGLTDLEDRLADFGRRGPGAGVRGTDLIGQRVEAALFEANDPLVPGLSADPVPTAELGEAPQATPIFIDKT
jgi:hypothetical protein